MCETDQDTPRWRRRPEQSTWGDYGADDQLGRMNELTAEKVLQGVAEVKHGKTFCLSMPLDYPGGCALNPSRHPPQIRPTLRGFLHSNLILRRVVEEFRYSSPPQMQPAPQARR